MSFTRADDLLGAWRLESAVEVFDDGECRDEFGPSPEGYLCYNPAGIVSATLGDSARPPVPAGDPQSSRWALTAWGPRETWVSWPGTGGHGPACSAVGVLPVRRQAP